MPSVWVVLLAAAGLLFVGLSLSIWWRARRSMDWMPTPGRVTANWVSVRRDSDDTTYWPEIRYTYEVAGKTYTGDQIYIGARDGFGSREKAEAVLAPYPKGAAVTVYCDPEHPERATLVPGRANGVGLFLFGGIFMLGLAAWLWWGG
jgi:hypothetical protein